jgi:hypothetical protein
LGSRDNRTQFGLPGAPTVFARATTCTVIPETFPLTLTRARFVFIDISNSYDSTATITGLAEIEFTGARVCN